MTTAPMAPPAPSVLVVDDEPAICNALRMILELEGYAVSLVDSGSQALARLEDVLPRVVLLDLVTPGMDGGATLDALKAQAPQVPVVLVSGARHLELAAADHHADGVLRKPFDVDGVLDTVSRVIANPTP